MLIFLIWFFLALFFSTWVFYPLFLWVLSLFKKDPKLKIEDELRKDFYNITFVIAAYNEQEHIEERINNLIALDYPQDKVEIIVGSDGSTDNTEDIIEKVSGLYKNVFLLAFNNRHGRAYIHNQAVTKARGDIIIFTDAKTGFDKDFLAKLLPAFSDSLVGCVSARVFYKNIGQSSISRSAGIYWKYEEFLRRLESNLGILSFGSGAALAIRKEIFKPLLLQEDIDRATTLDAKMQGYKVEYEPNALAYDYIEESIIEAHRARVRKTSRAFKDVLTRLLKINPFRNPLFFCSVFFHKTSRHLCPFYMIAVFVLTLFLVNKSTLYFNLLLAQILFYMSAYAGWLLEERKKKLFLFSLAYNFFLINAARFLGVIKSIFGRPAIFYNQ